MLVSVCSKCACCIVRGVCECVLVLCGLYTQCFTHISCVVYHSVYMCVYDIIDIFSVL